MEFMLFAQQRKVIKTDRLWKLLAIYNCKYANTTCRLRRYDAPRLDWLINGMVLFVNFNE